MKVTPQPARPGGPPILLGGYDRKAVLRAGRLADGYVTDETGPDEVGATSSSSTRVRPASAATPTR